MAWDIPTATEIADQASTDIEEQIAPVLDAKGITQPVDARSEYSVFRVLAVVIGLALYPVYLFFAWVLDQLFVDRCNETWLGVHARIWGVERVAASRATGLATFVGTTGTAIAAGTVLTLSGGRWRTTGAAVVGSSGSVAVAIEAVSSGAAGNRTAGAELALESPVVGLSAQTAIVGTGGITGGTDLEAVDTWRGRVIERIQEPPCGGADFDYAKWARAAGAAKVAVHPAWIGAGSVAVIVAWSDGAGGLRAATNVEVAAVAAAIEAVRPVTVSRVVVLSAEILDVDVTVEVSPWSAAVELAITKAATSYFKSADIGIAKTIHLSRLSEQLSRAAGEDWHRLVLPAATVVPTARQLPQLRNLRISEAST